MSDGPAATEAAGARLATTLSPGDVVLISGELGAGKTTLVRGACEALGIKGPVTSPTFTLGRRYRGEVDVSHLDLYRLDSLGAEEPGMLDDYLRPDAIAFVEWPPDAAELDLDRRRPDRCPRRAPPRRRRPPRDNDLLTVAVSEVLDPLLGVLANLLCLLSDLVGRRAGLLAQVVEAAARRRRESVRSARGSRRPTERSR